MTQTVANSSWNRFSIKWTDSPTQSWSFALTGHKSPTSLVPAYALRFAICIRRENHKTQSNIRRENHKTQSIIRRNHESSPASGTTRYSIVSVLIERTWLTARPRLVAPVFPMSGQPCRLLGFREASVNSQPLTGDDKPRATPTCASRYHKAMLASCQFPER
ncbi:hypothetical protein N658DRAFT_570090 [Parathielavia hyrcaniae]|uniref:Uncharacterized protein n=1 Tax=Parathielavia hyrcaniae TaxID=113614 RepID=A0AAN6PQ95_9PEZI|nr:hypothetical protein N658DRAFT_570090 [Parathielavia hyrcaniae]